MAAGHALIVQHHIVLRGAADLDLIILEGDLASFLDPLRDGQPEPQS
ncbi:hypothetical protein [Hyalangium minutum]|nr:hypothetical protein [Hyalangium minutum]